MLIAFAIILGFMYRVRSVLFANFANSCSARKSGTQALWNSDIDYRHTIYKGAQDAQTHASEAFGFGGQQRVAPGVVTDGDDSRRSVICLHVSLFAKFWLACLGSKN